MSLRAQGLRAWLLQRLSAVYMAVYISVAFVWLSMNAPLDFPDWQAVFAQPLINIFTQLFIFLLLAHAWVGVRDIFVDYVHHMLTRFVLLTLISVLQVMLAIWVFMALYSVVQL